MGSRERGLLAGGSCSGTTEGAGESDKVRPILLSYCSMDLILLCVREATKNSFPNHSKVTRRVVILPHLSQRYATP